MPGRIALTVIEEQKAWVDLKDKSDVMYKKAVENQDKYKEFFEYLDNVAELKSIKIEQAP